MLLTNRRSALCALVLALGTACATSEDPNVEYGSGGTPAGGTAQGGDGNSNTGGSLVPVAGSGTGAGGSGTSGSASTSGGEGGGAPVSGNGPVGPGGAGGVGGGGDDAGEAGTGLAGSGPVAGGGAGGSSAGSGAGGAAGGRTGGTGGKAQGGASAGSAGGSGAPSGGTGGKAGCDWTADACEALSCEEACPTNMGTYCETSCKALIDCVAKAVEKGCGTTQDPMCVRRSNGAPNACTTEWESSGSSTTTTGPSKTATLYFECACGVNVP